MMIRLAIVLALVATSLFSSEARAQRASVSAELGGASAAATINYEHPVGHGLAVRLGIGALPSHGVELAVPATVRYRAGGPLAFDVGAGVLVAGLSSEYLGVWVTHTDSPVVQVFPMAEGVLRRCLGRRLFARVGGAVFYDAYNPRRAFGMLPSVGVGLEL
jgi:hypothetical protein